jgi:hypothetical protein
MYRKNQTVWNTDYNLEIRQDKATSNDSVKIIIVSYMFNEQSTKLTKLAVQSIKRFTKENHEIWISDNNSPIENFQWVIDDKEINYVRNLNAKNYKESNDSFLNALGIEIGLKNINQDTENVVLMHSDIVVAHDNWLPFIKNKLNNTVKGVGLLIDNSRINAMHISGTIFSFDVYQKHKADVRPRLPDLDVGDDITQKIRNNDFKYEYCRNSHNDTAVVDLISDKSVFKDMACDRTIDDNGNVIFAHLGRGRAKSDQTYDKPNRTTASQWINNIEEFLK